MAAQIGHKNADRVTPADLDHPFGRMRAAGLSHSRLNNAKALLSGAYMWGRRHNRVGTNPVIGFELPGGTKTRRTTVTPELDELVTILNGADEHHPDLSPILNLAATTGMRRGELAGLRRDRLHLDRHELIVDTAVNDAGGVVVIKPTKTRQSRTVSLDTATIAVIRSQLAEMDERASICGAEVAPDGSCSASTPPAANRCDPS